MIYTYIYIYIYIYDIYIYIYTGLRDSLPVPFCYLCFLSPLFPSLPLALPPPPPLPC